MSEASSICKPHVIDSGAIRAGLTAEVIFAILPVIVIAFVIDHFKGVAAVFESPEFSLVTAVLFGQSLAKFTAGISRRGRARTGAVSLIVAVVVVGCLIPTVLVLAWLLECDVNHTEPSLKLMVSQIVLLLMSIVTFIILGQIGEEAAEEGNTRSPQN